MNSSRIRVTLALLTLLFMVIPASVSHAQSVNSYKYDAQGRLIEVQTGDGSKTTYTFDKADNRSQVVARRQFDTFWEAENLPHVIGYAEAGGWAANVSLPSGHLTYGPYTNAVPTGNRVATWRMLVDNNTADNHPVINIDVWDATAGQMLASRTITRREWLAANAYQVFELPFTMDASRAGHLIEMRTYYIGYSYARVDKVGYY